MKNNKGIIKILLAIFLVIVIICIYYNSINQKISRDLGVYVPNSLKFEYEDTHGGFLGDGILLAEANLNGKQINQIIDKSKTNWNKTPISLEKQLLIYGSVSDGTRTVPDIDGNDRIPEIDNGYWIFKDRTSKEKKERFPDSRSGNYSVGVIDLDTNTLYYIKFDS